MAFDVTWVDRKCDARCSPNPEWPAGIRLDMTRHGEGGCLYVLPYPAPRCGLYLITCRECGVAAAVTAAGRADDPVSVKLPCDKAKQK